MIIRAIARPAITLLTCAAPAPTGVRGVFGRVEVLELTSSELDESFGITLAPNEVESPFALAAALTGRQRQSTAAFVRKDRLVRLLQRRDFLLPCFVGYQEVPGLGLLPFMSDGPSGKWSLFFEEDGRMTLVERQGERLAVSSDAELLGPLVTAWTSPSSNPHFIGGLRTIGRQRSEAISDPERRVIRIGAAGQGLRRRSR